MAAKGAECFAALEAWSTAAAALFAAIAAFAAIWVLKNDVADRRVHQEGIRRSQAAGVAAWVLSDGRLKLRNGSGLPVFSVRTVFLLDNVELGEVRLQVLGPSDEGMIVEVPKRVQQAYMERPGDHRQDWSALGTRIRFRDSRGVEWARDEYGHLRAT